MVTLVEQLDIKIEADWDKIRSVTNVDYSLLNESIKNKTVIFNNNTYYNGLYSDNWVIHNNNLIIDYLPWYNYFLDLVNTLQYDSCSFHRQNSSITLHSDEITCKIHNFSDENKHCRILYVVSCSDPNCVGIIKDKDDPTYIEMYDASTPGKSVVLNINHPHEVRCNGYREVLSFKFCETVDTVVNHFRNLGPLVLK